MTRGFTPSIGSTSSARALAILERRLAAD